MSDTNKSVGIKIPEELWREFKILCFRKGVSMQEEIAVLVRSCVENSVASPNLS